jgi:hypothetical protein
MENEKQERPSALEAVRVLAAAFREGMRQGPTFQEVQAQQAAKKAARAVGRADRRAAKLAAMDEKLAAKYGVSVEQIRLGRAIEATRKGRIGFGAGIGIGDGE